MDPHADDTGWAGAAQQCILNNGLLWSWLVGAGNRQTDRQADLYRFSQKYHEEGQGQNNKPDGNKAQSNTDTLTKEQWNRAGIYGE